MIVYIERRTLPKYITSADQVAMLQTNRSIFREVYPVIFENTTFQLFVSGYLEVPNVVKEPRFQKLARKVVVNVGPISIGDKVIEMAWLRRFQELMIS